MTPPRRRRSAGPPRVVLDTNVVLSALVFGSGSTAHLRHAWQAGACVPLVSAATARELVRVLNYPKFRLDAAEQEELLADYLPYTRTVRIPDPPPAVPACRDPFDTPFLHLAVAGKATRWSRGIAICLRWRRRLLSTSSRWVR
jgi:putative PIN family toxin of toxin-antitoxin system